MSIIIGNEPLSGELPQWQKEIIDRRLEMLQNQPHLAKPIREFLVQLKKDAQPSTINQSRSK